jgi:hypothetical protein
MTPVFRSNEITKNACKQDEFKNKCNWMSHWNATVTPVRTAHVLPALLLPLQFASQWCVPFVQGFLSSFAFEIVQ